MSKLLSAVLFGRHGGVFPVHGPPGGLATISARIREGRCLMAGECGWCGEDVELHDRAKAIRHLHLLTKTHWECPDP